VDGNLVVDSAASLIVPEKKLKKHHLNTSKGRVIPKSLFTENDGT
jgi:hypothetical protein